MKKSLLSTVILCALCVGNLSADNDREYHPKESHTNNDMTKGHPAPIKREVQVDKKIYNERVRDYHAPTKREAPFITKNAREYHAPIYKDEHHYVDRHYRVVLPAERRAGWVIHTLPSTAFMLSLGGLSYYYYDGLFYHPYRGAYRVIAPPVGIIVPSLPMGYSIIKWYDRDYYFYDNVYYEWLPYERGYRVVELPSSSPMQQSFNTDNPIGTIYYELPNGVEVRLINGIEYYYFEGQYLLSTIQNGKVVYVVVNPQ